MRIFIGLEITNDIGCSIGNTVEELSIEGKVYPKENYHITLNFVGNIDEDKLERVFEICQSVAKQKSEFEINVGKLGYFEKKNKKILWVKVLDEMNKLQELYDDLANELKVLNFEYPVEYTPHMTIARNVKMKSEDIEVMAEQFELLKMPLDVRELVVFESKRLEGELRYIPIRKIKFCQK